jgi:peptidoglycan/LPS O-acetylase OafA/YrhL
MWSFFVSLLIFSFQDTSRGIWIPVGAAAGVVVVAMILCIMNTWDQEEEEQVSRRERFLSRLSSPYSNLRRHMRSNPIDAAA